MSDNFERRQPTAAEVAHGLGGKILYDGPCQCERHNCARHITLYADGVVEIQDADNYIVAQLPDGVLTKPVAAPSTELRESLAAVSHEIWAHWMRYQFSVSVRRDDGVMLIPADKVERWERQMQTDYADLTEQERESDRHQADKILAVLPTAVAAPEPDWSKAPEWATGHQYGASGDGIWTAPGRSELSGLTLPIGVDWRTTLRKRPEVSGDK